MTTLDLIAEVELEIQLEVEDWMTPPNVLGNDPEEETIRKEQGYYSPLALTEENNLSSRDKFLLAYEQFRTSTLASITNNQELRRLVTHPMKLDKELTFDDQLKQSLQFWRNEAGECQRRGYTRLFNTAMFNVNTILNLIK